MATSKQEWQDFFNKMEWGGGYTAMMEYGGPNVFPEEVREQAEVLQDAMNEMERALDIYEAQLEG